MQNMRMLLSCPITLDYKCNLAKFCNKLLFVY